MAKAAALAANKVSGRVETGPFAGPASDRTGIVKDCREVWSRCGRGMILDGGAGAGADCSPPQLAASD